MKTKQYTVDYPDTFESDNFIIEFKTVKDYYFPCTLEHGITSLLHIFFYTKADLKEDIYESAKVTNEGIYVTLDGETAKFLSNVTTTGEQTLVVMRHGYGA